MFGDLSTTIANQLGIELTAETLRTEYHAGTLSRFLSDGCCWLAEIDSDDDVQSLEPIDIDHAQRILGVVRPRPGALITRRTDSENIRVTAAMFPRAKANQQFQTQQRVSE